MYGSLVKRIVLTLVVVGLSAMSFARQEPGTVALYPRLGVNLSKLTGDIIIDEATGLSSNPKYKFGCVLGLEAQYQFSPTFGIISGLLYSLEGSKYSDTTMETETERWVVKDMSSDLHYLKLPLLLSMYIGRSSFQLKAGVQFGWLVKGKTSNSNEYYNNDGDGWIFDDGECGFGDAICKCGFLIYFGSMVQYGDGRASYPPGRGSCCCGYVRIRALDCKGAYGGYGQQRFQHGA